MQSKRNNSPSANQGLSTVKYSCSPYRAEIKYLQSHEVNFKWSLTWLLHLNQIMLMFWLNASAKLKKVCNTSIIKAYTTTCKSSEVRSEYSSFSVSLSHRDLAEVLFWEHVVWLFRAFYLAAHPVLLYDPAPMSFTNGNSPMHARLQLTSLPSSIYIPLDAPSVSSPGSVWSNQCKLGWKCGVLCIIYATLNCTQK